MGTADLYDAIQPLYCLYKIVGLASYNLQTVNNEICYVISKFETIFNVLVRCSITCIMCYFSLMKDFETQKEEDKSYKPEIILAAISLLLLLLLLNYYQKTHIDIFKSIQDFDIAVRKLNKNITYELEYYLAWVIPSITLIGNFRFFSGLNCTLLVWFDF